MKTLLVPVCLLLTIVHAENAVPLKRSTRSLDILSGIKSLPIFNLFSKPEEVEVPTLPVPSYPILKIHKYNGVHIKPVSSIPYIPVTYHVTPEPPVHKIKLPSLDEIKHLLGTTSTAEVFDILRQLVSTREGLNLIAGFLKQNYGDIGVDITKMSQEEIGSFISSYQYSTPAEKVIAPHLIYNQPHQFVQEALPKVPQIVYGVPAKENTEVASQERVPVEHELPSEEQKVAFKLSEKYDAPLVENQGGAILEQTIVATTEREVIKKPVYEAPVVENAESADEVRVPLQLPIKEQNLTFKDEVVIVDKYGAPSTGSEGFAGNFVMTQQNGKIDQVSKISSVYNAPQEQQIGGFKGETQSEQGLQLNSMENFGSISSNIEHKPPNREFSVPFVHQNLNTDSFGSVSSSIGYKPHREYSIPIVQQNVQSSFQPIIVPERQPYPATQPQVVYGTPNAHQYIFRTNTEDMNKFIRFPIITDLPALPDAEKIAKLQISPQNAMQYPIDNENLVLEVPMQAKLPVFSFSTTSDDSNRNVLKTKIEQPGFSYTQLSSLPLEQTANFVNSEDKISSYGDKISPYIFADDQVAQGSDQNVVIVKATPLSVQENLKKNSSNGSMQTSNRKNERPRWMPKSRRKFDNKISNGMVTTMKPTTSEIKKSN